MGTITPNNEAEITTQDVEVDETPTTDEQPKPKNIVRMSNEQFNERIVQAKRSKETEILTELGVKSIEELKNKINSPTPPTEEKKDKPEINPVGNPKDIPNLVNQLLEEKLQELNAQHQAERQAERLTKAKELISARLRDKAFNVDDVLVLATSTDDYKAVVREDGSVDEEKLNTFTDKLQTEKPHLFKQRSSVTGAFTNVQPFSTRADEDKAKAESAAKHAKGIF